jgi:hypothetical protein
VIVLAARAKLSMGSTVAKLKKSACTLHDTDYHNFNTHAAEAKYPHASQELSETLLKSSDELTDTGFGRCN